jgi:hypothetical protein
MYHILSPYKKYWNEIITKNGFENLDYNPYVDFKSPSLYDWCMFIDFLLLINILIQVNNINP